jgi:hypothetical protein
LLKDPTMRSLTRLVVSSPLALAAAVLVGCASEGGEGERLDPADPGVCSLSSDMDDAGDVAALKANSCNVPMSMGQRKWYRMSATVPGTGDVVQLELWDNLGAFKGGVVRAGTFELAGDDASLLSCGVCVRAIGDKGTPEEQEYFATSGTVVVTSVGGAGTAFVATISNATFEQLDAVSKKPVAEGCASSLAEIKVSGTVVAMGGGGGGGGGGSGGGNNCPLVIGD